MTVRAWDFFASTAVADGNLTGRVASSGQTWQAFSAGFASSLRLIYADSVVGGVPKRVVPNGSQQMNYLPYVMPGRTLRADARRVVLSTALTARGFIGVGFVDGGGNGYFGGWSNDAVPKAMVCLAQSDGPAGRLNTLGVWGAATPFVVPFARLMTFEYDRQTGKCSFFYENTLIATATDAAFAPLYPAVVAHNLGLATPVDGLIDVVFSESGDYASTVAAVAWRPYGKSEWVGEAVVNFSTTPNYQLLTESLLASGFVHAKMMAISSFDALASVTLSIDGAQVTVPAGSELVLAAPRSGRASLSGTMGVVRVRLYTGDYSVYQRG